MAEPRRARGPFKADQIPVKSRYELSDGHPVYCAPTGVDGGRALTAGTKAIGSDPQAVAVGIDVGFTAESGQLRAPDIAVGNLPDRPGWAQGAPPLAIEYAGSGQDEGELQKKIQEFLAAGTRWVWVVRLVGPRRVELYEPHAPQPTVLGPGAMLKAEGILRNPVPVEALYEQGAANRHALLGLLQQHGYDDLEAVREEAAAPLRQQLEQERAAKEQERAAKEAALARIAELEAQLADKR